MMPSPRVKAALRYHLGLISSFLFGDLPANLTPRNKVDCTIKNLPRRFPQILDEGASKNDRQLQSLTKQKNMDTRGFEPRTIHKSDSLQMRSEYHTPRPCARYR